MSDEAASEQWRNDFPIESGLDEYITRREFTKFLVVTSGAMCLGNGYFVLKQFHETRVAHPEVLVAAADEVPVGGVKLFRYPTENDPAMLIRIDDAHYVAYLQRCTHLTCPVMFSQQTRRIECPCHNGAFEAATGRVLEGPPPRPLPRINLRHEKGRIFADGIITAQEVDRA